MGSAWPPFGGSASTTRSTLHIRYTSESSEEFDGYVRRNQIKSITIRASVKAGVKYYTAKVYLKDGQEKVIAVIEPDQFITNLDKAYEEYSKANPVLFGGQPVEIK